jgi:hypothetical protein
MLAIIKKLTIDQQKKILVDFIAGHDVKDIAKDARISERSVYNLLDRMDAHRCRCGNVHERGL